MTEPAVDPAQPYRLRCTLTFGDIYGQILIWMLVIIVSLAAGLALMGASKPIFALAVVGSQDVCRYCGRLETVPPDGPEADAGPDEEKDAALAEVEQILDHGPH